MYVGTGCFYCLLLFTFIQAKTIFLCIVRHKKKTHLTIINGRILSNTSFLALLYFLFLASVYELELALCVFIAVLFPFRGAFSVVKKAVHKPTGIEFAAKIINTRRLTTRGRFIPSHVPGLMVT